MCKEIKHDSTEICKEPSDRDCPPDARKPDRRDWSKKIGEKDSCAERNDGKDYGDTGLTQSTEQAVKKEQAADTAVAGAFYPKILCTNGDDLYLIRLNEQQH